MVIQDATYVTNPVVSVIICSYNQETTIAQTLDGILMQDFAEPFEIVLGEDGSRDNTAAICRQYQERFPHKIKLLLHESNVGIMENIKATIAASSGKYMAFCAGDDYWIDERKLSLQYAFLREHEDCGLVHTGFNVLHVETGIIDEGKFHTDVTDTQNLLINGNFIMGLSVMADASLIKQAISEGILDMGFLMEDFPLWLYIGEKMKFGYLNEAMVVWRKNAESLSNTRDQLKELHFKVSSEDIRYFFSKRTGTTEEMRQLLVKRYRGFLYWAFTFGDQQLAIKCFGRLKELNGASFKDYLYVNPFLKSPIRKLKSLLHGTFRTVQASF